MIYKYLWYFIFIDVMDDILKNNDYWNIGLSEDIYTIIMKNKDYFNSAINYDNDYNLDYFGFNVMLIIITLYVCMVIIIFICLSFSEFNTILFI